MIQRIQSIYLLVVVLINGALPFWLPLWTDDQSKPVYAQDELLVLGGFGLVTVLALGAIFMYKNRKNQFVINRLNMIFNLFLLGFFVYRSLTISGETNVSEKGIGMLLPIVSIVFLVLANKAIKKDEDLVKSVDRLR